ncbi:MAG: NAD-dependent dehydratase [Candidatus Thorarchaeota archaeon]|nr:MAG: NAD-dependent dehydratase [Candidatus Thorarchaeota archaeon]
MDETIKKESLEIIERLGNQNKRFAGKVVLLTGAAGFLGMRFMYYFATLNDYEILYPPVQLIALDSFIRGQPSWIADLQTKTNIRFIKADITGPLCLDTPIDFIIHAASIASPTYYRKYPIHTMDANVVGLRNLLDYAVSQPPESMLFFSSSEVYGDPTPEYIPTPETYPGNVSFTGPRACYDESKRFGETLCVNFYRVHKTPIKIVRPFNNYGPGLNINDGRVIADFFSDVLANRDIRIYSDGTPTRTFCYITDAITGYLLALLSDYQGEAFNIGADAPEISIKDLAEKVIEVSGKALKVVMAEPSDIAYLKDSPKRRCPDITKARRLLGYEPRIGIDEGLSRLYHWYRIIRAIPKC